MDLLSLFDFLITRMLFVRIKQHLHEKHWVIRRLSGTDCMHWIIPIR